MNDPGIFLYISINAGRANPAGWGDTQYAEGLARAVRRHAGCDCTLLFRGEEPDRPDRPTAILRIAGPHLDEPLPDLPSLLWMISPPDLVPRSMLERYDAVLCASRPLTVHLNALGIAAQYLPQATEIAHFDPRKRDPRAAELPVVFVGALASRVERRLVLDAVEAGLEPAIWGPGWQGAVPDRLWHGVRLNYHQLAATYAQARIVLNSHMAPMARMGFMSNRSYDALSAGAWVISDRVHGFDAPDLPELIQVGDADALAAAAKGILALPPRSMDERIALHTRIAANHSFDSVATVVLAQLRRLLAQGRTAAPARHRRPPGPFAVPILTDPAASAPTVPAAMAAAAREILAIARYLEQAQSGTGRGTPTPCAPLAPPQPAPQHGVIHPLMRDLRDIQHIALSPGQPDQDARIAAIALRARRVDEAMQPSALPLGHGALPAQLSDQMAVRAMHNAPFLHHSPDGFSRDRAKISLPLWPRRMPPPRETPVGVFLHLFYDSLAPVFAERLAHIACPWQLYISTDSDEKAARIATSLPQAEIRVLENRGRDIWPKLSGFADRHDRHDLVLHLHGKQSLHAEHLDAWLAHILACLLGSTAEVNRILSFFQTVPRLGMVTPVTYRRVLSAAHWAGNRDIAREIAWRMGLQTPLPDDHQLRFPVGSMFWARTAALRPVLDLRLRPEDFPAEAGQLDATLAHALERMLGVACMATGHRILPVSGQKARLYTRFQKAVTSNGELRLALDRGDFDA